MNLPLRLQVGKVWRIVVKHVSTVVHNSSSITRQELINNKTGDYSSHLPDILKNMKKKRRHQKWFVKVRWSYLPNSWQGWLTYVPMILFLALILILIHHQNRSWLSTVLLYAPYLVCTGVVMHWLAGHKS